MGLGEEFGFGISVAGSGGGFGWRNEGVIAGIRKVFFWFLSV